MKYIYIIIIIEIIAILSIIYNNYNQQITTTKILKSKKKLINFIDANLSDYTNKLILFPHLELGDNLIFNGIVRYFCKKYSKVVLVCKKAYYKTISYMYSDLNNLLIYQINGGMIENNNILLEFYYDNYIANLYKKYNIKFIPIGLYKSYYNMIREDVHIEYPLYFFDELKIPYDTRYTEFKIKRDYIRENIIFNKLVNIVGDKYNIIIDDEKRNFIINKNVIKNNYPVFKLGNNSSNSNKELDKIKTDNIFDYIKLLENAYQIHTIDSCLVLLVDILNLNVKTFIYKNYRPLVVVYKNKNFEYIL